MSSIVVSTCRYYVRRKLETDRAPRVILTERGVGYVFALPVKAL